MAVTPVPPEVAAELRKGGKVAVATAGVAAADLDELLPGVAYEAADVDVMGPAPWAVDEPSAVAVVARTPTDLRRAVALGDALPDAHVVAVIVLESPQWCDAPGVRLSPGLGRKFLRDLAVSRHGKSGWRVRTRFSHPRPAGEVAAAVARGFGAHQLGGYALPAAGLAGSGLAAWRPGDPGARFSDTHGPAPDRADVPAADLAVRAAVAPGAAAEWNDERVTIVDRDADPSWARIGAPGGYGVLRDVTIEPDAVPPVDERSVNPRGFLKTPAKGYGTLERHDGATVVRLEDRTLTRLPGSGAVTDADIGRLRRLRGVRVTWRHTHGGPIAAARTVASLAAAGVPMLCDPVPDWAARGLGPGLTVLLTGATERELADDLRREEHSVRLRRTALGTHGTTARWRSLAAGSGVPLPPDPTVSVVMCTRRAGLVPFALGQIARQRGVDVEVILGLHGVAATAPEVRDAVAGFDGRVTVVEAEPEAPFGVVLNRAAARASGSFISKWDDDDWYGPDHLADLVLAQGYSGAELVGVASEFFYLQQIDVTVRRNWTSETMSDHVAGGAFIVSRSAFEALGGFRPVPRAVDVQFFQALLRAGGAIYRTHGLGFVARRAARGRHTWQEPVGYFLARARDQWPGFRPSGLMDAGA
ncbi:glycosyltransferase family A protein [Sphaerisporangium sp. B11E5]|uniref:glycosyltransferase n=1 Tax=Sphaerisporangium sp. B11E5 TaxID=3153563 RepID=UPI00325DDB40